RLDFDPAAVHSPEELVVRIRGRVARVKLSPNLVRRGQHDLAVKNLDGPALGHEPAGQIVQQFGVRRPLAERAEVGGRADDAPAEVPGPDAVDDDAGRQGIILTGNSLSQLEPAATL